MEIWLIDFINFDGVLSGGSFSSNNLSRAILLEAPLTKNIIFEEAERTFGVNEILFKPLPSLKITKSSTLLFF